MASSSTNRRGARVGIRSRSPVGRLDKALDEAPRRGWTVIDLKRDWKTIHLSSQGMKNTGWLSHYRAELDRCSIRPKCWLLSRRNVPERRRISTSSIDDKDVAFEEHCGLDKTQIMYSIPWGSFGRDGGLPLCSMVTTRVGLRPWRSRRCPLPAHCACAPAPRWIPPCAARRG